MNSGKFPSALVLPFSFLQKSHCSQLLHPCRGLYTWEQRELDGCTGSLPKVQEVTGAVPETEGTSPRVTAGDGLFLSFPLWWQTVIKGHQYMTKTLPVPDKQEEETINGTRVKSVHGPAGGNESKQHTLKIKKIRDENITDCNQREQAKKTIWRNACESADLNELWV